MRLEAITPGQDQDADEDRRIDEIRRADGDNVHPCGKGGSTTLPVTV